MKTGNLIGHTYSNKGTKTFQATNPATKEILTDIFHRATKDEVNVAVQSAENAFPIFQKTNGALRGKFLREIAKNIEELDDQYVEKVMQESGLPKARVLGERGRTCGQLRMFAELVEKGSWVNATIDEAIPDRPGGARDDLRLMQKAVGPVVVFTASNFPQAFSTAGGDTASALAAGCPVIVKAHPSHPSTNAYVSDAIFRAAKTCALPDGVFTTVYDDGHEIGTHLVLHPSVKSVAFTGSLNGGMALHKLASQREEPIPVFAEMGSINPVFILDEKLKLHAKSVADQLSNSINMGAGQFCTNPGIQVVNASQSEAYLEYLTESFQKLPAFTMLNEGIFKHFEAGKSLISDHSSVTFHYIAPKDDSWRAFPAVASVSASDFVSNPSLQTEIFGPFSLVVICDEKTSFMDVAHSLKGQLSATIMGEDKELEDQKKLLSALTQIAGRIVFNGVPTGVEVCHAMQHGGPYPASTDPRFTSVGSNAIYRFTKPVCYQNCPDFLLPDALKKDNPLKIVRKINGELMTYPN